MQIAQGVVDVTSSVVMVVTITIDVCSLPDELTNVIIVDMRISELIVVVVGVESSPLQ